MNKMRNRRAAGFTLLEVMLVMLILTMLAGGAFVGYVNVQEKAKRDNTAITIQKVEEALKRYHLLVGVVPDEDEGLNLLINPPSDEAQEDKWRDGGPFITGGKLPKDEWGHDLIYKVTDEDEAQTKGVYFRVYSPGPNGEDDGGTGDDIIPKWAEED